MKEKKFKMFFKNVKTIKKIPPLPKNFDTKHLQDFIEELEILSKGENK